MALSLGAFPGCCGIHIVQNFGHTPTNPGGGEPTKEEVEKALDYYEAENFHSKGLVLIALNTAQKKVFAKTMEKYEFEPVVENFYHPGHRSKITLYARKTHDSENKRKYRKGAADKQTVVAARALEMKKQAGTRMFINTGSWSTSSWDD